MNQAWRRIFVIDDDLSVRRSVSMLLKASGYQVESFSSAEEFLEMEQYNGEGCIILDIFMEGRTGLEIQDEIAGKYGNLPVIYISGQGDIPMSVQAMKKGAVNFLQKPVDELALIKALEDALHQSKEICKERLEETRIRTLFNSLTSREFQIYRLLTTGMLNKQIAAELDIAEHTVKLHRGKITEKLGVKSVAELVKLAQKIKL